MSKNDVTILIVDDTPENIDLLNHVLRDTYKIKVALSGQKALNILDKTKNIDMILLDIMMPEMDGYEVCSLIKQDPSISEIPIIFISALGDSQNEEKGLSLGAVDYISKPINPSIVKARIATQLELYNSRKSLESDLYKNIDLLVQYKHLVDNSSIVSKTDPNGRITYVNEAFEKISGYTKEELIGKSHNIVRHPDTPSSLFEKLWKTIQGKRVFHANIKNLHKNGSFYYVKLFISPVTDQNGEIEEYISIRQDITSEILALEEEKKINRSKDEFISNMSHELRTPLNSIIGFSAILNKQQTNPEHRKLSQQISSSANSLLDIVNSILDLSYIKDSTLTIEPFEFDFYEKSTELVSTLKELNLNDTHIMNLDISDNLKGDFYGDWNRINQVIINLVSNAIKFTPNNCEVGLKADYKDECLVVSVSDNGIGISQEAKEHIFKPFQQADGSRSRSYGGTGTGLTITKSLVELMNGNLELESQLGVGTTVTVNIPLKKVQKLEDEADDLEESEKDPLGIHVLVAEDNKTNQMLIEMLLEEFGITCDIANDGLEALDMYNPDIHAMILMDEDMPNMNGTEAMKKIREKYQDKCGAIIAVTASSMAGDRERFLEAGMDEYISKPIDEDILYKTIKQML